MIDNASLQELSSRLAAILPKAGLIRDDLEKQFFTLLQGSLSKLELVTREEFDSQLKVLKEAEETIAALEARIAQLEQTSQH